MNGTGRDRGVDVLRGLAVLGVVLGHWLVTAPLAPDPVTGAVLLDSPLRTMPDLAPLSWLLQTLGLFCVVAGFAAARSRAGAHEPALRWWWTRVRRLAGPAAALLAAVTLGAVLLAVAGAPQSLVVRVVRMAVTPLWFLGVHLVLSAATPLLVRLDARYGGRVVVGAAAAAAAVALLPATAPLGVLVTWWVPWQLGIAMARRPLRRAVATALLVAGTAAVLVLTLTGAVAPTAVGVPGADRSNLDPPSPATLALALAQGGAAALALPVLARRGHGFTWTGVLGSRAYPVFLVHQVVFAAVWLALLPLGPLHGLHDGTGSPGWLAARSGWLGLLGAPLAAVLHRSGRSRAGKVATPDR